MPSCVICRSCSRPGPAPAPSAASTSTTEREHRPNEALLGPVLGIFAEPQDDGGDDQGGAEVGGSFGVAGGQGAELLEPSEAALNDVAPGVDGLIEPGWPATGGALGLAGDLIGALGTGEGDASVAQRAAGGGVGVGLV